MVNRLLRLLLTSEHDDAPEGAVHLNKASGQAGIRPLLMGGVLTNELLVEHEIYLNNSGTQLHVIKIQIRFQNLSVFF